jgi:hypothetical protein
VEVASDLTVGAVTWCYVKTVLVWMAYGTGAGIVLGLVAAIAGGLLIGLEGFEAAMPETLSLPVTIVGGVAGVLIYIAFLLGLDIIRRLFLDRGIWAAAANSVTLKNLEALHSVVGAGAGEAGSMGEGLLDALDMGGF